MIPIRSAAFVFVLSSTAWGQNLVGNPSFETPPAGSSFTNRGGIGAMGAWDVIGNVDHIGGFWTAADGVQSVDMNGSAAATVAQTLNTIAGRRYRVRYAASENLFGFADKTMNVRWNDAVIESVVIAHDPARTTQDMRWRYRDITVVAAGATSRLAFESTTGAMNGSEGFAPFYGPALDDVSVTEVLCCAADFNCDGAVSSQDFFDFLAPFFATDLAADVNDDGAVNSQDFFDFLSAFFAGC